MWMRNPVAVANQIIPLRCPRYQRRSASVTSHFHPEHSNTRRSPSFQASPSPLTHPPSSRRLFASSTVLRRTTRAMASIPGETQTQEDGTASGQNDSLPVGSGETTTLDPESDDNVPIEAEELQEALSRPPAVNSSYLPLPWTGRLGYACLNTYLRNSNPPVFCSRTCRIASILDNRHPLQDPSQPAHPTKNRPDKTQVPDVERGQAFVEALGLANARDLAKLLRWNDRYGIKFMRISSEMFPFASHKDYGYKLAPFAFEALGEAGRVVAELNHRVTVHPGQFTQLGSPRKDVVENAIRDLEYHSEMLQLLRLPPQQNRDAVMILHMGGVFGDKEATLERFRQNYQTLPQDIKNRLVLENDDVSWSVHDLLPICEELNIPFVLDYHHHNIIFDDSQLREGTLDIMGLYDRIKATWTRKNITQKMHYSEPVASAITKSQRRKHSDRVSTLPPCDPNMDLMIEAKNKEQAVFELMRNFKLPGHELVNDIIPYARTDENKPFKPPRKSAKKNGDFVDLESHLPPPRTIPDEEVGMGGPDRRVYWPPGMEEYLRPKKVIRAKAPSSPRKARTPKKTADANSGETSLPDRNVKEEESSPPKAKPTPRSAATPTKRASRKRKASTPLSTPDPSENEGSDDALAEKHLQSPRNGVRRSRRTKAVNYAEDSEA
ncbi:UV-endonuclease UVE-1 [Aspergillus taichungensis]|uniref:UV-endonuclease UVE-1 n=1 Tax=Aspergillus taichungensis TaxID=482145 RepID=A0A2J5I9J6_9EURO|nr:UV-endonuclease UVE-1 [Aspergillus taichungensis]